MKTLILLILGSALSVGICFADVGNPIEPHSGDQNFRNWAGSDGEFLLSKKIPAPRKNVSSQFPETVPEIQNVSRRFALENDGEPVSNADFAELDATGLVAYLQAVTESSRYQGVLFNFEAAFSPAIFTNEKIRAVSAALQNLATTYDGSPSGGVYGLIGYLHVAVYFDFYHHDTISLDTGSWAALKQATDALSANTHMLDLNPGAAAVLNEFLAVLDSPGIRSSLTTLEFVKRVMRSIVVTKTWKTVPDVHLVEGYWSIFYLMFRGASDEDYLSAIASDDEYLSLWGAVAVDSELMNAPSSLKKIWQDNAVAELRRVAGLPALRDKICPYLKTVHDVFPRLSKNWLNAVTGLIDAQVAEQYGVFEGEEALKDELSGRLFPHMYSYDDGRLVFKAKFAPNVANNLYYASKQTRAQFFRLLQTDQPLSGDPNDRLTAFVFESFDMYEDYAPFLFGITTNNGGMYIERTAEFYTWDRPSAYYLSLEELFRHEYNHYLQGRFLIPGFWGETPFYDDGRLVWFEEGQAEFLCGSTDFDGIQLRPATINRVVADSPGWPTLAEVLSSTYNTTGAIYYPYGNLVWFYWYKNDYGKIKTICDLVRSDDVAGFDQLMATLSTDPAAETQWQSFLTQVAEGAIQGWKPATNWTDDRYLTVGTLADLQTEFSQIAGLSGFDVSEDAATSIHRFKVSGELTASGLAASNAEAAASLNHALDTLLLRLKNDSSVNNFDFTVGYLTDISYQNGVSRGRYVIAGTLRNAAVSDSPVSDFISDRTVALTGTPIHFSSVSTGYVKTFAWTFPGGAPSGSGSSDPVVVYDSPGNYDVSLTASQTPASPLKDTKTRHNYVKVYSAPSHSYPLASNGYDFAWISRVQIAGIDNVSDGFPENGYSDFSSKFLTELSSGGTYAAGVELSYVNSPGIYVAIWIDLNQNGSFDDPGEQVLLAHPEQNSQIAGAFLTIPAGAKAGVTRMRVRSSYTGSSPSPAGEDYYMGETEDYSVVIVQEESPLSYPIPSNGYDYSWISRVQVAGLDHSSVGFPPNGYSDFTADDPTEFQKGSSYPAAIELSFVNSPSMTVAIWIDFNRNGSFDDSGEQVALTYPPQNAQPSGLSISIPQDAVPGITRMRVRSSYDGNPISSSEPDEYMGETEDYRVEIMD